MMNGVLFGSYSVTGHLIRRRPNAPLTLSEVRELAIVDDFYVLSIRCAEIRRSLDFRSLSQAP
jgi:hypothetical protein